MRIFTTNDVKKYFYASCILAALCLLSAIMLLVINVGGNTLDTSMVGSGTMNYRHDSEHNSDIAMAENASIMYDYSRQWDAEGIIEKATSYFVVSGANGGYNTQYAVRGSGANHKVDYRATRISGDASFASEISLSATESGGENFDSMIWFDTRDGNATIQGRVYNLVDGRPATIEELDAVGKYLLNTHLNVSNEPIVPENWLGFCEGLDQDVNMPEGIYILPVNDSKYNYSLVDGKIIRSLNTTVPIIVEEQTEPEIEPEEPKLAALKERAAKSS